MNDERYNWFYWTEPERHLGGRRLHCPARAGDRGVVLD